MPEKSEDTEGKMSEELKAVKSKPEKDEVQITITLECERKLHECLGRINNGFELGRVTRKHLTVFVIEKLLAHFTDDDIQAVRQSTLTDFALLDKVYRDAKTSGVVPQELKEFLWKSINLTQGPKRAKKSGHPKYSADIHEPEGAA